MWANILTKPLQGTAFRQMHAKLMNCMVNYDEDEVAFEQSIAKSKACKEGDSSNWESDHLRSHQDTAGVCWGNSIHQKETNKGQTISWYVQSTSKIWKPAEGQETGEEPVKCTCVCVFCPLVTNGLL
jgi:hypothetical protein